MPLSVVKSSSFRSSKSVIPIVSIKSSRFIEPSTSNEPSCRSMISSSSSSFSSSMSPKILSERSCRVMMPSVLPNSLITTANLSLVRLNTSSTFLAERLSGTNWAGCAMLRKSNSRPSLPTISIISFTDTTPIIWSRSSSTSKYLLKCSSLMVSSTSSGVSVTCKAIMSRRGVIRSLARLSEKRNTSRSISFSSWSITPCSELWLSIIFSSSCVICRSSGFMPINLFRNLVEMLNRHTNGYAMTEIICIKPLNLAAYRSGSESAIDFGTSSPITIDK